MRRRVALLLTVAILAAGCAAVPLRQPLRGELARGTTILGAALGYCASAAIEDWTPTVRRVIVAVHGLDRDACAMRQAVVDALGGEPDDTVVVAPHFATREDAVQDGHAWGQMTWPEGAESNVGASSFAVLDELVASFGDRTVTLVGFSGGGQFTNRYAAVSPVPLDRYVVINASSYLWFSRDRPAPTDGCPQFDHWRYGLDHRNRYASRLSIRQIEAQYAARAVTYMIGTSDDDPRSSSLDRSCGAAAQGANREERVLNYRQHLRSHFGDEIRANQPLFIVPGVGHDGAAMLGSPAGRTVLGA